MQQPLLLKLEESIAAFREHYDLYCAETTEAKAQLEKLCSRYGFYYEISPEKEKDYKSAILSRTGKRKTFVRNNDTVKRKLARDWKDFYTFPELCDLQEEINRELSSKQDSCAKIKEELEKHHFIFRGKRIPYKLWKISDSLDKQRRLPYLEKSLADLREEANKIDAAKEDLNEQILDEHRKIDEVCAQDTAQLERNVGSLAGEETVLAAYNSIFVALDKAKDKSEVEGVTWIMNPAFMDRDEIKIVGENINKILGNELYLSKTRNAQEILARVLNNRSPEDIAVCLERGTPFKCQFSQVPDENYYFNRKSYDESEDYQATIQFNLIDPRVQDEKGEHLPLFHGNFFWFPNKRVLGGEHTTTHWGFQASGIGRVVARNILDLAQLLGAERLEGFAGESVGPYFWAKCGAQLQEKTVVIHTGLFGENAESYFGRDAFARKLEVKLKYMLREKLITADKCEEIVSMARENPEKALWFSADSDTVVEYSGKKMPLGKYLYTDTNSKHTIIKYAHTFDLTSPNERAEKYLPNDLTLDLKGYNECLNSYIEKHDCYRIVADSTESKRTKPNKSIGHRSCDAG